MRISNSDNEVNLNELEALVILASTPLLGSIKIRLLLNRFGSALEVLQVKPSEIADLPGFGPKITSHWGYWTKNFFWKQNLELASKFDTQIIPFTSPSYPKRLLEISDFPILLYVKGKMAKEDQRCIAVVGTRQASIYGNEAAEKISKDLASLGFTVISGLARGIDTSAHKGALEKGRTLAVIGSGLANIYPHENKFLAEKILEKGALISEFPMETPPDRQNFPQRNRIVSGMSMGVVLIEAPLKSGAMITMEKAKAYKRKLFVLPGRAGDENFKGNHTLIKQGAQLVENANDIANAFDSLFVFQTEESAGPEHQVFLEKEEKELLHKMPNEELTVDELAEYTKLPIMKLNVLLMSLILKKVIKEYPGKIYKKIK